MNGDASIKIKDEKVKNWKNKTSCTNSYFVHDANKLHSSAKLQVANKIADIALLECKPNHIYDYDTHTPAYYPVNGRTVHEHAHRHAYTHT